MKREDDYERAQRTTTYAILASGSVLGDQLERMRSFTSLESSCFVMIKMLILFSCQLPASGLEGHLQNIIMHQISREDSAVCGVLGLPKAAPCSTVNICGEDGIL